MWIGCFILGLFTQAIIFNLLKSLASAVLTAVSFLISLLFYLLLAVSVVTFLYLAIKTWKDSKNSEKKEEMEEGEAESEQPGQLKRMLYKKKFTVMGLCFVIFSLCLLSIPGVGIIAALIGVGISSMEKDEEDSKWSSAAIGINFVLLILSVIWTISSAVSFFSGSKEQDALPVYNPDVHGEASSDFQEKLEFDIESFRDSLYAEQGDADYKIEENWMNEQDTPVTEENVDWQQETEMIGEIPESYYFIDSTEPVGTTELGDTEIDGLEPVEEKMADYQRPSEYHKRTWTYNTGTLNNTITITDVAEDSITFDLEAVWTQVGKNLELNGITAVQDASEPTRFNFDVGQASGYIDIRSGSPHGYILYDTGFAYIDINGSFE